jgi:hypothetical protein
MVPPEIVSTSTGLPRKMILVPSLYSFGPDLFQALHGASMRHSLNVLAEQVKLWSGPSLGEAGNGNSNQQYQRNQYGRMQGHNGPPKGECFRK